MPILGLYTPSEVSALKQAHASELKHQAERYADLKAMYDEVRQHADGLLQAVMDDAKKLGDKLEEIEQEKTMAKRLTRQDIISIATKAAAQRTAGAPK